MRSVRTSRIGVGSSRRRAYVSRVTRRSRTCSTAAPRSRRSRRVDNGSSSRVSTNDSGSRSVDRPLEIERRLEPLLVEHRHERPDVLAARDRLPRQRRHARAARRDRRRAAPPARPASSAPTAWNARSTKSEVLSRASALSACFCTSYFVDLFEKRERQRRQRRGFFAGRDDRQPRPREREQQRRHPRAGDGDVRAHAARGGLAAQLFADGLRRPEQARRAR